MSRRQKGMTFNKRIAKLVAVGGVIAAGVSTGLSPILAVGIWHY